MTAVLGLSEFKGEDHAGVFRIGGTCWVRKTAFSTLTMRNIAFSGKCFSVLEAYRLGLYKIKPSSVPQGIVDSYSALT